MNSFAFNFPGKVLATCPIETFAGKKDPTKTFRRWVTIVRLDTGSLAFVSDWDPPAVLPDFSGSPRVMVYFDECRRKNDVPGAVEIRGKVVLSK